ncbi:hypothetical protein TNCV_1863691 [Trichonephila clavipes]|nr:hypothetical protein TNCV_1863691 [Trichonephila clavipes]
MTYITSNYNSAKHYRVSTNIVSYTAVYGSKPQAHESLPCADGPPRWNISIQPYKAARKLSCPINPVFWPITLTNECGYAPFERKP